MRVLVIPRKKKTTTTVEIDREVYAAMQRLEDHQGIPVQEQLWRGMKQYLNSCGVHVTKSK